MPALLPRARRASRVVAVGGVLVSAALGRWAPGAGGRTAQQGLVLAALALGMPHGAADTELLRSAARGDRRRHAALVGGYALLAAAATGVVHRGGPWVERVVLVGSAAHFAEGELACWRTRAAGPGGVVLRALAAATTTVALPAAVGQASRLRPEVGVTGALGDLPDRATGEHSGLALLRRAGGVRAMTALAAATAAALLATGDREAAGDTVLLIALDLIAPPATAFAGYFGGWHALRHTARVVDALVERGALPEQPGLPTAVAVLGRRSAWAAGVGLVAATLLAVRDPRHASDNAFAAVLGLTAPHMATVALGLSVRRDADECATTGGTRQRGPQVRLSRRPTRSASTSASVRVRAPRRWYTAESLRYISRSE